LNTDPEPDEKPDPDPYNKLRILIRIQDCQKHTDPAPAPAPNPEHYFKLKVEKNTLFGLSLTRHYQWSSLPGHFSFLYCCCLEEIKLNKACFVFELFMIELFLLQKCPLEV
jgi:hypothetical protein